MRDPEQGGSQTPRNSRELAIATSSSRLATSSSSLRTIRSAESGTRCAARRQCSAERCEYMVRKPSEEFAPAPEEGPARPSRARPSLRQWSLSALRLRPAPHDLRGSLRRSRQPEERSDGRNPRRPTTRALTRSGKLSQGLSWRTTSMASTSTRVALRSRNSHYGCERSEAYRDLGIDRADRPQIRRSNIVIAEPLSPTTALSRTSSQVWTMSSSGASSPIS